MRYEDWDILLFPRDCKVPIKEFKVACHVVHDAEFSHSHGSFGLPTVCCFVPSLPSGTPFQVSIHSWCAPTVSQYTRSYSKYADQVKFEARLFIDGRLVASAALDQSSSWPHVIAHSFDFSKTGDLECLRFPAFRREVLQQSYWTPADDLGRIKVVISEGFPRDSLSMPLERVKNIVTFSFQHAPLDILESSSIAWPNPSMWRRAPFASSMVVPSFPADDADSHAHSPRRRTNAVHNTSTGYSVPAMQAAMPKPSTGTGPRRATHPLCGALPYASNNNMAPDPLGDANVYFEWLTGMGMGAPDINRAEPPENVHRRSTRRASTDVSMPDYVPMDSGGQLAIPREPSFPMACLRQDEEHGVSYLKVPTNTPMASGYGSYEQDEMPFSMLNHNSSITTDLANSLTNSLLNQPMPLHFQQPNFHEPAAEVKSRKENRLQQQAGPSPSTLSNSSVPGQDHQDMRRVSQQMFIPPGSSLPVCTVSPQVNSPPGQGCSEPSQRMPLVGGELSACVRNLTTSDAPLAAASGNSLDRGTKRLRNFTPASARAIDDEDEPRRASPRVRLTPFAEEVAADEKK